MVRRLDGEERALWAKVVATVKPLGREMTAEHEPPEGRRAVQRSYPSRRSDVTAPRSGPAPGNTLDGNWDRRLAKGLVRPDVVIDLHGHNLAAAHARLDNRLGDAIAAEARVVLLITGKPPRDDRKPAVRGAIRAAVGDWILASRHAASIASVRSAHPRHGGPGALYIILRRPASVRGKQG